MTVVGIDACRGRWLAVALVGGRYVGAALEREARTLARRWPEARAIGVDIPIGLPVEPWREADRAARAFVAPRWSSVFPTFPRAVLEAPTYDEAKALSVKRGWPRPSVQSYGMRHRILEIEWLAREDERVFEVHPDVSFRELVGRPLSAKRTSAGRGERRVALGRAGLDLPDLPYPVEDVLDAAVAAWSADRYARGHALPLPDWHRERIGAIWR